MRRDTPLRAYDRDCEGSARHGVALRSTAGERELPLPVPVWDALRSFKALQVGEKLTLGPDCLGSGYVLVDEMGEVKFP
ncbi:hypothetical protein OG596_05555 [Streptomyces sp. NBC_01102]|uniref:hypothetical protein n=1 Tax=unclassified Streptomyces TaxID=2593676 RepID=UPI00386DF7E5|nr:hypothetical protein OG596_05555 [Streptomyces sp. NBC_01102]